MTRQVVATGGTLVSTALLLRHFGAAEYGLLMLANGIVALASALVLTLDDGVRRFLPEYVATGDHARARATTWAATAVRLGTASLLAGVLSYGAASLASAYQHGAALGTLIALSSWQLIAQALETTAVAGYIGLQRYRAPTIGTMAAAIGGVGIAGVTTALKWTPGEFITASLVVQFVIACGLAVALHGTLRRMTPANLPRNGPRDYAREVGRLWRYSWPLWGGRANLLLYQHAARTILGMFVTPAAVGYFSAAKSATESLASLYQQVPASMVPPLVAQQATGDRAGPVHAIRRLANWALPVSLGLSLGIGTLAPEVMVLLGGAGFAPAAVLLQIFALQPLFRIVTAIWSTLYHLREDTRPLFLITGVRALPMAAVLAFVIPVSGIHGAAMVEMGIFAVTLWLLLRDIRRRFGAAVGDLERRVFLASALSGAVMLTLIHFQPALWIRLGVLTLTPILARMGGGLSQDDMIALRSIPFADARARTFRNAVVQWLQWTPGAVAVARHEPPR